MVEIQPEDNEYPPWKMIRLRSWTLSIHFLDRVAVQGEKSLKSDSQRNEMCVLVA